MAVNSLGLGSGVLTSDLIDKLRAADDAAIVKPFEAKVTLANQKEDAAKLLSSLMTTFKSSTSSLGGETLYLGREVSGGTDAVSVTASSGSDVQSFNITNVSKAEKDVWNSTTSFSSTSTALAGLGTGTLTIAIGDKTLDFDYTPTTTIDDIKLAINDNIGESLTASSLQIGNNSYSLAVTADSLNEAITFTDSNSVTTAQKDTITLTGNAVSGDTFKWSDGTNELTINLVDGEDPTATGITIVNAINNDPTLNTLYTATATANGFTIEAKNAGTAFSGTATSTGTQTSSEATTTANIDASNSLASILGLNNIQVAKAATFDYNGISISRSTNDISDLINGVTITLNQNQLATDTANIKITQNNTSISETMSKFVENYNSLASNLKDMTAVNTETGTLGIFNSDSFIKSISRTLTNIITQTNPNGNSLVSYGLTIARDGTMSLDSTVFDKKFKDDPAGMELLFRGDSSTDGIFKKLNTQMTSYTSYDGALTNFSNQLDTSKLALTTQYDKQKALLDSRYETMTKKFTAYDAMISKINSQFSSLQMMIDAEVNAKSN